METPGTANTGVVRTDKVLEPWKPLELLTQGLWGLPAALSVLALVF